MTSNNHDDNPWGDQQSQQQGQSYQTNQNHNPYQAYQEQPRDPYAQQPPQHQTQDASPWGQEPGHPQHLSHNPYDQPHQQHSPQQSYQQPSYQQQQPPQAHFSEYEEAPPGLPPRRTATDMALPTGQDRSHQIEVMQSYEAAGRKDEDDANVEILQREYPKIDGSLIAAIYGDSKSLSATREMLQALE
ncbi:hypothetical protein T440DRAFT_468613 [Plenodomus tracheiphilus IPT5]|uniref:Uncharacterized protein n=1 Tax=Plenodomus tracheiphilus IPT5 TaxID=1408161 RepID=A0A6A7B414_9PLEO|nr:hypothetical protein T440DRAFT_468613 [Plenodomus tracheiphilus IPT5]